MATVLAEYASDTVLDTAYISLCHRRQGYPADADVWSFRREQKRRIQADLYAGCFRLGMLDRIALADGSDTDLWSARDALVRKALATVLPNKAAGFTPVHSHEALRSGDRRSGGAKAAVRQVSARLGDNRFVFRTDVKSYYASIEHVLLLDRLAAHVKDRSVLNLLGLYMRGDRRARWSIL